MTDRADFGSCWCCGQYGIVTPAISQLGMCASCRGRSPSACQRAHQRQTWQKAISKANALARTGRARRKPPAVKAGMHRKRPT